MNFAGVKAVGDMLRAELEPLGFKVEWIDMRAANRAGHIVARHKGKGRGKRAAADRPPRHGVRAGLAVPALGPRAAMTAKAPAPATTRAGWR